MSRADKIRAVAQQAHDNGDCMCCLPDEMVEFESAKQTTITRCDCGEDTIIGCGSRPDRCCGLNADEDTITITISREDAEFYAKPAAILELLHPYLVRLNQACRAALEGER